jgi:hypothetical protein
MSTSEKWEHEYSSCPCGKGKIIEHVDSPDNPWSRTTFEYTLECKVCAKKYILVNEDLRDKQAYEEARNCWSKKYDIERKLTEICKEAINEILKDMRILYPKEEYRILVSAGICKEGPIRYPRFRKEGMKAGNLCQPLANIDWIIDNLRDTSKVDRISKLKAEMDRYESRWSAAMKKDKPIPITSLRRK